MIHAFPQYLTTHFFLRLLLYIFLMKIRTELKVISEDSSMASSFSHRCK